MRKIKTFALMMGIALTGTTGFTACSSSNVEEVINPNVVVDENGKAGVKPEFVISIPRTVVSSTRMDDGVTQSSGSYGQFRGLDNIRLIPFDAVPTGTSQKLAEATDLIIARKYLDKATANGKETSLAKIIDLMKEEKYLTAQEVVDLGLADGVIKSEPRRATDTAMATNAMWKTSPCTSSAESEPPRRRETPANIA